jgi:hypothetical protein
VDRANRHWRGSRRWVGSGVVATQVTLQLGIGYLLIFPFWIARSVG